MLRRMMSLKPLIAVCGTTGVGKSKLAIELALALSDPSFKHGGYHGARVINADAMQVYAGLDILTNKVTEEEKCGVDHLLMGFKHPGEQYVVGQWVKDAMHLIEETHERNQVPIVVGGTSYWIQHLIFPERLLSKLDDSTLESSKPVTPTEDRDRSGKSDALMRSLGNLPPELLDLFNDLPAHPPSASVNPEEAYTLHTLLCTLDPTVGQRWHWKDTRKVLRSLVIIQQTGRLPSEIIDEQSKTIPEPRYRSLCFWLYARPEVLNPRLDDRVDHMLEQGLLDEVIQLEQIASLSQDNTDTRVAPDMAPLDYTLGIYQSIGFREFSSYLSQKPALNPAEDAAAFRGAIDRMKLSTRKYAKRQVSWIRNKLLPAAHAANTIQEGAEPVVPVYLLDATELGDSWLSNVQSRACGITESFLEGQALPDPHSVSDTARLMMMAVGHKAINPSAVLDARRRVVCSTCTIREDQPVMIEEGTEWASHVRTRRHRRLAAGPKPRRVNINHSRQDPEQHADALEYSNDAAQAL